MRLLPYSKRLLEQRARGEAPWLVLVTMGHSADRQISRSAMLAHEKGIARVWVPDDFSLSAADLRWALGLDVFVAPFCDPARLGEFLVLLWRARPATLWQLDAGFTGTRLCPWREPRAGEDFTPGVPSRIPLDDGFAAVVRRTRELALLVADEPLFHDPRFSESRAKLLAA